MGTRPASPSEPRNCRRRTRGTPVEESSRGDVSVGHDAGCRPTQIDRPDCCGARTGSVLTRRPAHNGFFRGYVKIQGVLRHVMETAVACRRHSIERGMQGAGPPMMRFRGGARVPAHSGTELRNRPRSSVVGVPSTELPSTELPVRVRSVRQAEDVDFTSQPPHHATAASTVVTRHSWRGDVPDAQRMRHLASH